MGVGLHLTSREFELEIKIELAGTHHGGAPGATTTGACGARRRALPLSTAHEIGYARVFELALWQLLL